MADTSNAVLYGVFSIVALFTGTLINLLGPRLTAMIASIGYPIYTGERGPTAILCEMTYGSPRRIHVVLRHLREYVVPSLCRCDPWSLGRLPVDNRK